MSVVFDRGELADPLFTLDVTGAPQGYTVAFLPDEDPGGTSITLAASWDDSPGIYLFLGRAPTSQNAFVSTLRAWLNDDDTRFFFLSDPDAPSDEWSPYRIRIDSSGSVRTVALSATIAFRNYQLVLGQGCAVVLDGDTLIFNQLGVGKYIRFEANNGADSFNSPSLTLDFAQMAGRLLFTITALEPQGLNTLDAGCRYFTDDPDWKGLLTSYRYPILLQDQDLQMWAALDPLNALDPDRSALYLLPPGGNSDDVLRFNSGYRTVYGQVVSLSPTRDDAESAGPSLVFAIRAQSAAGSEVDPYYLSLRGVFELFVDNGLGTDMLLMMGTSGLEYAKMPIEDGAKLHFIPGKNAYAPSTADSEDTASALKGPATTSWNWLTPAPSKNVQYMAQPEDAVLYGSGEDNFFQFVETFAGEFEAQPAPYEPAFPMAPYGMADPDLGPTLESFELTYISPARRTELNTWLTPLGQSDPNPGAEGVLAITPQGLLLELDPSEEYWRSLTMAKNTTGATPQTIQYLKLQDISGGLKDALQSNQLFSVVSRGDLLSPHVVTPFDLTLDGWDFLLDPNSWLSPTISNPTQTMMIFKYSVRSLRDLATDTSVWGWTDASTGWSSSDGTIDDTQRALLDYIEDTRRRGFDNNEAVFKEFYQDVLDNQAWNGVLFINAPLSGDSLPQEVQGLMAGIDDPDDFFAHHVIVNATPFSQIQSGAHAGDPKLDDSSVGGLIFYEDPEDLFYNGEDYDYKVLSLRVLFENSAMVDFSSQVELMINKLFDEPALLIDSERGNNVVLNGYFQRSGASASYVFVDQGQHIFQMGQKVLSQIVIDEARMVTVQDESNLTINRFLLGGALQFMALDGFDIFSFGSELDGDRSTGLRFRNLAVQMSFDPATPTDTSFEFDAATLSFDLSRSSARVDSLYSHFPLQFMGLIQSPQDSKPGDLGYMAIRSPLPNADLSTPWYALSFDLELGSVGSLAADAGLSVTLVAAWEPSINEPRSYVGLKLPGSVSAKSEIPIEHVLKLSFGSIDFVVGSSGDGVDYILRFRQIALRLLGFSFPPGQTDLYLFGDPSGAHRDTLGWYAAYDKDPGGGQGGD